MTVEAGLVVCPFRCRALAHVVGALRFVLVVPGLLCERVAELAGVWAICGRSEWRFLIAVQVLEDVLQEGARMRRVVERGLERAVLRRGPFCGLKHMHVEGHLYHTWVSWLVV